MKSNTMFIVLMLAIILSSQIFLSYLLRQQPLYFVKTTIDNVFNRQSSTTYYTQNYINQIVSAYAEVCPDSNTTEELTVDLKDSLFHACIQQLFFLAQNNSNDIPSVYFGSDHKLRCILHVKAKKRFDVEIVFKKEESNYKFDSISNFKRFLQLHPNLINDCLPTSLTKSPN